MSRVSSLQDIAREHIKVHAKGKGGNIKFTCNHCNREFTGSQTRQLAHLTGTSGSGMITDSLLYNAVGPTVWVM